jgi:cell division protein FtsW (lipid II flippase)
LGRLIASVAGTVLIASVQELFGGLEGRNPIPMRFNQVPERLSDKFIVIDNRNHRFRQIYDPNRIYLSATIGLVAIVPLLIAMMMRDGTATLVTALLALGAILLCATQESDWTLFAIFQATAAFLLAFAAIIRQRRSRAFRDQELHTLKRRLNVVE